MTQILHDVGRDNRVESMAAEVAVDAIELEAPGIPSNPVPLFDYRDSGDPFSHKLVRSAHPGGAGAENHDVLVCLDPRRRGVVAFGPCHDSRIERLVFIHSECRTLRERLGVRL